VQLKKNYLFFNFNNLSKTIEVITFCKKAKIFPILCIKYYIIKGFGPDWLKELKYLLLKKFNKKDFNILVDCKKNYGLFICLVQQKLDFLQVNADNKTLLRLRSIAKKNKVTVNPKISVINISNTEDIKLKLNKYKK
tara:strand:- start:482 stop:892 length:411 start_codon:yes stop_codon:yes gene_type:complete